MIVGLHVNEYRSPSMNENNTNVVIYMARLHWVIFVWPVFVFFGMLTLSIVVPVTHDFARFFAFIALVWIILMWVTYHFSYLLVKKKQVILCRGIVVRQTLDIPLDKIASIDIRQSILGSIFQYGSLVITGTGGTQQCIKDLARPLTCRRYIEQLLHD